MISEVPIDSTYPYFIQTTTIENNAYQLQFVFNERDERWRLSLLNMQDIARHSSINMTRSNFAASHLQLEQMTKTMEKLTLISMPIKKVESENWDKPAGFSKNR